MFSYTMRASRASITRLVRQPASGIVCTRRTVITPTAARQDLIRELYLREIKAYTPPPVNPKDIEGNVHPFSPPATPAPPEQTDLVSELKEYELSSVETEGQAEAGSVVKEDDWFEEEPEDDKHSHH
ncbi:hypothetical protein K3495_g4951 [Podosphaera aphanis]|nr:hypothetical protein K3495_g4951 [Podosphaera aphanis]